MNAKPIWKLQFWALGSSAFLAQVRINAFEKMYLSWHQLILWGNVELDLSDHWNFVFSIFPITHGSDEKFGSKEKSANRIAMVHCIFHVCWGWKQRSLKMICENRYSIKNWHLGLILSHTNSPIQQSDKFQSLRVVQHRDFNRGYKFLKLLALESFDFPLLLPHQSHHSLEDTWSISSSWLSIHNSKKWKSFPQPCPSLCFTSDKRWNIWGVLFGKSVVVELWLTFEPPQYLYHLFY